MTKYTRVDPEVTRRKFVNMALGTTAGIGGLSLITVIGGLKPSGLITPANQLPSPGDILVHADGDNKDKPVAVSEVQAGKVVFAYPQGQNKGKTVLRDGQPRNQIALLNIPDDKLKPPTDVKGAPNGVIGYSSQCMHLGCTVAYRDQEAIFQCPCHGGQYDPTQACKVIGGPPPAPLPQLPLKIEGSNIVVADFFTSHPFGQTDSEFQAQVQAIKKA